MKALLVLVALFAVVGCSRHKPADPRDVYRDVPESDRETLRAAARRLVEFQRSADWEKMFEITEAPKDAKDRFIRRRSAARPLKEFVPTKVTWVPDGWVITGCGVYQTNARQSDALVSSLHATPNPEERGQWSFSAVAVDVVPGAPGNIRECSPHRAAGAR